MRMATPSKEANSVAAVAACNAGENADAHWSSPDKSCSVPAESTCVALSDMKSKWSTTWDLASRLFASSCTLSADAAPRLSCASARVDITVRAADYRSGRICGQHITCLAGRVFVAVAAFHFQCQVECDKLQVRGALNRQ